MVLERAMEFRSEVLQVADPRQAASPETEQQIRDVPLFGEYFIGSDIAKGYSKTVDPGPNAPHFEGTGERIREDGVASTVASGAADAAADFVPDVNIDFPTFGDLEKVAKVLLLFAGIYVLGQLFNVNVGGDD